MKTFIPENNAETPFNTQLKQRKTKMVQLRRSNICSRNTTSYILENCTYVANYRFS